MQSKVARFRLTAVLGLGVIALSVKICNIQPIVKTNLLIIGSFDFGFFFFLQISDIV